MMNCYPCDILSTEIHMLTTTLAATEMNGSFSESHTYNTGLAESVYTESWEGKSLMLVVQ